MTDSNGSDGRGAGGRFTRGNRYGRGNPNLARLARAQAELRESVQPGDVAKVLGMLRNLAVDKNDVQAARAWLERVLGRAVDVPVIDLDAADLGKLRTAKQVANALVRIVSGAVAGELPLDVAERIAAMVAKVGEAGAWLDLAVRVGEIEKERSR